MKLLLKKNKALYQFLCRSYAALQVYRNGRKADKKALRRFRNIHQGERCFVIGNGPSLALEDLQRLQGEYTFASNKIYTVFDKISWRPTYFVVSDNDITPEMYEQSKAFDDGVKAKFFPANFRDGCVGENKNAWFYNYVGCDTSGKVMPEFCTDMTKYLMEGFSVAYVAMQMAVYMGFKEIYLLGIDFSWSIFKDCQGNIYENGEAKHRFYEENHEEDEISIPNVELMENAYKQALQYCDAHAIRIYNATRGGKLEVFSRVSLDTLVK